MNPCWKYLSAEHEERLLSIVRDASGVQNPTQGVDAWPHASSVLSILADSDALIAIQQQFDSIACEFEEDFRMRQSLLKQFVAAYRGGRKKN